MGMDDARRLVLLIILALVLVGLLAFARGPEHRRGPQQVGAFGGGARPAVVIGA
jgi:hypothetical protein